MGVIAVETSNLTEVPAIYAPSLKDTCCNKMIVAKFETVTEPTVTRRLGKALLYPNVYSAPF